MVSRTKLTVLVGSVVLLTALLALGLATVSAAPGVDLRIDKRATGLPGIRGVAIAGEELIYEIYVRNDGDTVATDVVVDDYLPEEVIYLGSSPDICDWDGSNPLTCYLGDMDRYEYLYFEVKVLVAPWALVEGEDGFLDGTITMNNYAVVGSEEDDDDPSDNSVNFPIFVEDSADLTVVKMSKPDTHVRAGELFTYTIYVENLGPSIARFVGMRDNILSSGDFELVDLYTNRDELDGDVWCEVEATEPGISNTIFCGLLLLEPKGLSVPDVPEELLFDSGQWIINVVLRANETQDVNNLVEVFPLFELPFEEPWIPTPDPDMSNNMAEDFIYVTDVADLSINKWWVEAPSNWFDYAPFTPEDCYVYDGLDLVGVRAGCPLMYQIGVDNVGPSLAENVVVEDLLPAGVRVEGVGSKQGTCTTGIPGDPFAPLTCNLGYIENDSGAGIEIFVMTDADLAWEPLENDAWVYSDIFDPYNGNNRAYVLMGVEPFSYLDVQKTGPLQIRAGEEIHYNIDVNNYGPSTAHDVHLDDELPGGVNLLGAEVMIGDGSCVPGSALCSLGDMEPGSHRSVRVRGYVEPWLEAGTLITNTVRAWAQSPFNQPSPTEPLSATWETLVLAEANLSIVKTSEPPKIFPGEQKVYHITVTNNGPSDAPNVVVSDTLPMELRYQIDTDNCDVVGGPPDLLRCDLGTIPAGESVQFDIHALVEPDYPVTQTVEITNTAEVWMETEEVRDPNRENNSDWTTNLILPPNAADLELTKSIAPPPGPPFYAGGTPPMRFRLQVTNHGPSTAENVVVEDMLPQGVTVVNFDPGPGSCTTGTPGSTPLRCDLGTLAVDAVATVDVRVRIDPDYLGILENDAWVYSDIFDPNNSNDRDSVIVAVQTRANLTLDKDAPPPFPWYAGEIRTYRYNINNSGPSVSRDVRLRDFLPDEVEFVSAYAFKEGSTGGIPLPCNVSAANVLICPLGDIAPTDPPGVVVLVDVYIKPDVPDGTWISNSADLITDTSDPGGAWDSVGVEISNEPDLSVRKEADPWKVYAGEQVMYTIEVINNGPGNAYGVFVTDTLPSDVQFELVTDPACYPLDGMVECYWEGLALGETKTFYIFVRVDPGAEPGTVSNSVEVVSDSPDPVGYNDYASAATLIQGRADLKIQKFGKPEGEVRAGDELTYTVIVYNLGTGYAHNVTLDDVLESDGSFDLLEVTSDRDALCDPETGTFEQDLFLSCALSDTLEVKGPEPGSGRWMITVVILANEPQDINNVAFVAGADYDPDLSNNEAMAEHEITAVADLELTKEAWGEMLVGCEGETELWLDEVAAGGMVSYTLTVSNTGPSTAENVTVLDEPLPYPDLLEIDVESIEPSQGECLTAEFIDERRLNCNLGTIGPEMSATVTFVGYVPSWVPDYTVLINDAQVYSDMFDDNNGNDFSTNHTIVSRVADLMVEKTQDPEIALPGWDITYSITVTNLGLSDAEGVFISDTIPVQVLNPEWTCCASDGGECDVQCEPPVCPEGPCEWPDPGLFAQADIPAGEWVIYTITGILDWWPCGPFTNTVEVIAPEDMVHEGEDIDPCPENNTDIAVNDPFCHYDPLVLKEYPGPDSPP